MIDAETGTILFSKDADKLDPAGLACQADDHGGGVPRHQGRARCTLDDTFVVSENAWRTGGATSGGSTMFAKLKSTIRLEDLIQGVIVQSANDGCIIIAEGMAGSEENFAAADDRARARDRADEIDLQEFDRPAGRRPVGHGARAGAARPAHLARISRILQILRPARLHLEQDHAAEPQSAAGHGHRRRRHEDRLHRRVRLRDRRLGQPRRHARLRRR